jgi:hypothetical protein
MSMNVRVGGAWKDIAGVSVRVGGSWKTVSQAYVRVAGTWEELLLSAPTDFTYVGGSTGSVPRTLPAGLLDDNTYLGIGGRVDGGAAPSGWTSIGGDSYWKILTAAEASSSVNLSAVQVWRANAPITSVSDNAPTGEFTNANPAVQTVTAASILAVPALAFGIASSTGVVNPFTVSPAADQTEGVGTTVAMAVRKITGSASNTTFDMDDEGSNNRLVSMAVWVA